MTTDEFISKYPKESQLKLNQVRKLVKKLEPDAKESFSYGVPSFKLDNRTIIIYSAFKNHIGIYPTPIIIESFKKELKDFKTSKGGIQFPLEDELPIPLLTKIIKACAEEEFTGVE